MITGQLKLIVMQALCEHKESGYSLMKHISQSTGWKPSTGSIYPLLEELLNAQWVTVEKKGRKKIYTVTKKGREEFVRLSVCKEEFIDGLINQLKVFESFFDKGETGFILEILHRVKRGEVPFHELGPEIIELRGVLFELDQKKKLSSNKKKINAILRTTVAELKALK
jgi:DNA-binding PadR family transcriptional regulator